MSDVINVHEFKTNYSKYLGQAIEGKAITLGKHGKPVAKLVRLSDPTVPRKPGALKGKIWISDDFDAPMMDLLETAKNK